MHAICILCDNWPVIWTGVSQYDFRNVGREGVPITDNFSVMSRVSSRGNFQTGKDMFTNDDVMSTTQAEGHCNLKLQLLALRKRMNLR